MTAEQSKSAGALSHLPDALSPQDTPCVWHNVDWQKAHQQVRRLQVRIVKATQQGRWNKVQALQHLLTHSFSGKVLAVRRVTENDGKKTAGVDGQTWDTPAQKAQGVQSLRQRGYQPHPLRRVYIPKSNGKRRPLGIPMCHSYCTSMQWTFGFQGAVSSG